MRTATVELTSVSPYSQSKNYQVEKLEKESPGDYEKRTWRERMHRGPGGNVFIPPMAFKNCLAEAAKFLAERIPGKGKATYTKHFEAGVLVTDGLMLPNMVDEVEPEWLFVPSDGRRGGGSRVWKCFGMIPEWTGTVTYFVLDETVTESVFEHTLDQAGKFIGVGRFRPRNNGFYGRFKIKSIAWSGE